ncbi:MAG: recombinase RecT, partial [Exiguobacterium sp.]|nr:recombinase RecT [Exiguobacterium sp.]
ANYVKQDAVSQRLNDLLGKRAPQFVTSLVSAANNDKNLAACEPQSVVTAALTAASLDLPVNSNLGFAYLIPYTMDRGKKTERTECQFQMGYKGFIQLAQRSGFYKTINASEVREGEIVKQDRLSGEIEFNWIDDDAEREKKKVIGYVAYFRLLNGFEKTFYWTKEKCEAHAKKYSKNYAKYGSGLWKDAFDDMAKKTVLKLLISKFGPLNTQLQKALDEDQTVDGEYEDNPTRKPELTEAEEAQIVEDAEKLAEELEEENGD